MLHCTGSIPHLATCHADKGTTNLNQQWKWHTLEVEKGTTAVQIKHLANEFKSVSTAGVADLCVEAVTATALGPITLSAKCKGATSTWHFNPSKTGARSTGTLQLASAPSLCLGAHSKVPPTPKPGHPTPNPTPAVHNDCSTPPLNALPYCDASKAPTARTADLLARMTLDDKLKMLGGGTAVASSKKVFSGEVAENTRWGIPPLRLNDGPQGFRERNHSNGALGTTTQFPSGLAVASTFDVTMARKWGRAMAEEFSGKGANVQLGPGMCLHRVVNDGRNFEYMTGEGARVEQVIQNTHNTIQ